MFNLNLYTITEKPIDFKASAQTLDKINWSRRDLFRNVDIHTDDFPDALKTRFIQTTKKEDQRKEWHLNLIASEKVNDGNTIAQWQEDVFFQTSERTTAENVEISIIIAALIVIGSLYAFLMMKRRKNV